MGWAAGYVERLKQGKPVAFRPRGHSMKGRIESGSLVTVEPIRDYVLLKVGDVVLCKVHGREYLHIIKAIEGRGTSFLIGNNRGGINGWTSARNVFGVCTEVQP